MTQITHAAFVVQPDGVVFVCDGEHEAAFETIAQFQAAEPAFALPRGVAGVNYERPGADLLFMVTAADGAVRTGDAAGADAALANACRGCIAKAARYAAEIRAQAHPFHGITNVHKARIIAKELVAAEFERRARAVTQGYGLTEQATWPGQLAEARAVMADADAPAPLLEAILTVNETKAGLAAKIIAKADAMNQAARPLLRVKRRLFDEIDAAGLKTLKTFDAEAQWAAASPPDVT